MRETTTLIALASVLCILLIASIVFDEHPTDVKCVVAESQKVTNVTLDCDSPENCFWKMKIDPHSLRVYELPHE